MKLSKEARKLSRQLFRSSIVNGSLDAERVRAVSDSVISAKPRQYVGILKEYARLVRLELARHHATVTSAVDLSEDEMANLKQTLQAKHKGTLSFSFSTDASLIGGINVQVGSDVWDSSVRSRLRRLSEEFNA